MTLTDLAPLDAAMLLRVLLDRRMAPIAIDHYASAQLDNLIKAVRAAQEMEESDAANRT